MPVRELADELRKLGRPILPSGITKIEQGTRRVDADDLVALSVVLGVSPNRLLLGPEAGDAEVGLTEGRDVTLKEAWRWATGMFPLPEDGAADGDGNKVDFRDVIAFRRENRPHEPGGVSLADLPEVAEVLRPVWTAASKAVESGRVSLDEVIEYLRAFGAMAEGTSVVTYSASIAGKEDR